MKGGTLPIRRTLGGIRLRVASGTHDRKAFDAINEILTQLEEHGHLTVIRDVKIGLVTPLELLDQFRTKAITKAPLKAAVPLVRAIHKYLAGLEGSEEHRRDTRIALLRLAGDRKRLTAESIPALLRLERERCLSENKAHAFNHLRNYCRGFLKATLGRRSEAYEAVVDVAPLRVTRKRDGHPCTVPEALATAKALGEHVGAVWLTLCFTGARPKELWGGRLRRELGHVRIAGTKTRGSDRLVFSAGADLDVPPISYVVFRKLLKKASKGVLQPYDARRTFSRWLELAGVPVSHQRAYMGHGAATMTDLYKGGNIVPYLDRDAGLLAAFVGLEQERAETESVLMRGNNEETHAPRWNRTINLLIKSQQPDSATDDNEANPVRIIDAETQPDISEGQERCGGHFE